MNNPRSTPIGRLEEISGIRSNPSLLIKPQSKASRAHRGGHGPEGTGHEPQATVSMLQPFL